MNNCGVFVIGPCRLGLNVSIDHRPHLGLEGQSEDDVVTPWRSPSQDKQAAGCWSKNVPLTTSSHPQSLKNVTKHTDAEMTKESRHESLTTISWSMSLYHN